MVQLKVHICTDPKTKPFDALTSEFPMRASGWEEPFIEMQFNDSENDIPNILPQETEYEDGNIQLIHNSSEDSSESSKSTENSIPSIFMDNAPLSSHPLIRTRCIDLY